MLLEDKVAIVYGGAGGRATVAVVDALDDESVRRHAAHVIGMPRGHAGQPRRARTAVAARDHLD